MSNKEVLTKFIDLVNKGYCSDCNELNCIDNFPMQKVVSAIKEVLQENKQLLAKTTELESNNRLLLKKLKKTEQQLKIKTKECEDLKNDISDVETYLNLERCVSCEKLTPDTVMSYVGNEQICESCRVNGYGL